MSKRPQFSLKALFVITAALATPLAMLVSGDELLAIYGCVLLYPVLCSCIVCFLGGWKRALTGLFVGTVAYLLIVLVLVFLSSY